MSDQGEQTMKRTVLALLMSLLVAGPVLAQETCDSKALDKNGKALAGAAKKSFVTKCKKDACEPKALDKNGKPLAGAAKKSFLTKCEKDA
jgi:hypothetical protein